MTVSCNGCDLATSRSTRSFLPFVCRSGACGRRTRHPVDSLETVVQNRGPHPTGPVEAAEDGAFAAPTIRARARRLVESDDFPDAGTLLHDGRYLLIERLGAGGFGVVWRARDELLHREVALKRVHGRPDERARREALAAARLAHPAIVALYEAFVADDAFHLVSELVHGKTLASLISEDRLDDERLLEIGVVLAQALEHAHSRGVVHRDVKPHNVLVPAEPAAHEAVAKLTDFGGAWLAGEDGLTRTGETLGTLAYMAPEQCEGHETTAAADLYSLALVLREGLTGVNPVRGPTPTATARRIGRPLPTLAHDRPDLPPRLIYALDTAVEPDRHRRGSVAELREALDADLAEGSEPRRRRRLFERPFAAAEPGESPAAADFAAHPRPPRQLSEGHGGARDTYGPVDTGHAGYAYGPVGPPPAWEPAPSEELTALDVRRPRRGALHGRARGARNVHEPGQPPPAAQEQAAARDAPRDSGFPVPRAVWLGCLFAGAVWLAAAGKPGAALLLLVAVAPVLLLLGPRPGIVWAMAGLAPALGLVGLAGVWPALAGQASSRWTRALLGALGYWWLTLAGALVAGGSSGPSLWLAPPGGLPSRQVWEGSLGGAAAHVIGPALSLGVLLGAALWAGAAVVLPWLVRGRGAVLDTVAAVVWSAALLAATPYFDAGLASTATLPHPRGVVLAAVLAAAVAVGARALRGPIAKPDS